jgi:RHH-type proline utilization regulon transcriptional repressor/proline dehydrogenase/delta 1-pyrroline-5-carboxylate dehydrogenase
VAGGSPDVAIWADPVTAAGRIEVLPFLLEQAVSITAHRFGNPDRALADLPL